MGSADVVPGVSGGTVALVLGIYEKLIDTIRDGSRALGTLLKGDIRGFRDRLNAVDFGFIVPLLVGILIAVVSLASLIQTQLHDNPENMAGLFLGLVAASVIVALRLIEYRGVINLAILGSVAAAVFVLLGMQSGPVADPSPVAFFAAGALAICAMILPGISGSFILLMLGMYSAVIGVVDDRALASAALVAAGAIVGLALFSSLLAWILERAFQPVMAALIGIMVGSMRVLWPWPNGVGVISKDRTEIVSGTGLEWPSSSEWVAPTALAIGAIIVVLLVARFAESSTSDITADAE